jgi:hypothetical protein
VTLVTVFDENRSPYLDHNIQTFTGDPASVDWQHEGMRWLDPMGRIGTSRREATRSICHPSYLAGHPDRVYPTAPLRRLTSIRDGTAPGGSDSLADPTPAARPISRRSVAFFNQPRGIQTCRRTAVRSRRKADQGS